jgi:hypothetical protein
LCTPQKLKLDKTLFSALDAQLSFFTAPITSSIHKLIEILPVLPSQCQLS